MSEQERADAFCRELTELSRKYNMALCVTPWDTLGLFDGETSRYEASYYEPPIWHVGEEDIEP